MSDPSRPALVAGHGVAVSDADAIRITAVTDAARAALERAVTGSLFDTEPAHFDRWQIAEGTKP